MEELTATVQLLHPGLTDFLGSIDLPKIPEAGEDAPAIALATDSLSKGVLAVCDGMGGAGSRSATLEGLERSEAWHAARIVSSSINRWFRSPSFSFASPDVAALDVEIDRALEAASVHLPQRSSALKSRLFRRLPTTTAVALWHVTGEGSLGITAAWLGDSRIYGLSPDDGLFQITVDDVQGIPDALESLREDPPLQRCINADQATRLNRGQLSLSGPLLLIAATDGFFGYLPSPLHLEAEILRLLTKNGDWEQFLHELRELSLRTAADDVSIALALLGEGSFADCKAAFEPLHEAYTAEMAHLEALKTHASRLRDLGNEASELADASLKQAWRKKSKNYYRHALSGGLGSG